MKPNFHIPGEDLVLAIQSLVLQRRFAIKGS